MAPLTTSSPSPSPSPTFQFHSSNNTRDSPSWHFPGPSSVYHKRERERPRHRRNESSYVSVAPALSTEKRAQHRRTRSSAVLGGSATSPLETPTRGEKSRSPLCRFASYTSADMAAEPRTPAPSIVSGSRPGSKLQDSPFSDYFTDDGRSVETGEMEGEGYSAPSPEAQHLLRRLNKIQGQLMRGAEGGSERDMLGIVGKRLDNIDLELDALHSQTRNPAEMEDSGLFMDEEDEGALDESGTPNGLGVQYDIFNTPTTKDEKKAEYDYLLLQAQQALSNVSKAEERLRQRHAELRQLNDVQTADMDEREREIEGLKSENEAMRLDLGHDHSELLFLKLQHKALEVEFDALENGATLQEHRVLQRKKLQDEMERWRQDWQDVDGRMRRRRAQYGVYSPKVRRDSAAGGDDEAGAGDDGWKLETVTRESGRVESILIRRLAGKESSKEGGDEAEADNEAVNGEEATAQPNEEHAPGSARTYSDQGTQTPQESLPWLLDPADESDDPGLEDDCAVTTSEEDNESPDGRFDREDESKTTAVVEVAKTAWQDLWEGLSSLAGMSDERF